METLVALDNTAVQVEKLLTSEIDDEVMLLHIVAEKYYSMDAVGSRIWQLLAQPCKIDALCDQLLMEFDVDRPTCEADVLEFLQTLTNAKLVEIT